MIYILLFIQALLWGLSFLGTKILLSTMSVMEILAVRWTLACLSFTILILFGIIKVNYKNKRLKPLIITAAIQPCVYSLLETWGVNLTTASESSIFTSLVPLAVVLLSWILLKQRINIKTLLSILLSFCGVVTCIWFAPDFSAGSKFIGYIVLIAAVFSGALYVVYLKKHSSYYSSLEVTYIMTIGGCLFFNVLSLTAENGLRGYQLLFAGGSETAALLFLGVGCSCIAYAISAHAISKLKTVVVSNIQTNSATVVGVIAGITLGGDTWGWYTIIGLIMTITGICLCSLSGEKS